MSFDRSSSVITEDNADEIQLKRSGRYEIEIEIHVTICKNAFVKKESDFKSNVERPIAGWKNIWNTSIAVFAMVFLRVFNLIWTTKDQARGGKVLTFNSGKSAQKVGTILLLSYQHLSSQTPSGGLKFFLP